jgi:hypothetical protein
MQTNPAQGRQSPQSTTSHQQFQVRSGLRAGATKADCALGVKYWRQEYNDLKKLAQSLGCA